MVVKRQRNGRRRFDPQAKRELIEACLQPGVSVAGLALEHGVNANLLRKWITRYRQVHGDGQPTPKLLPGATSAFIPVVTVRTPERREAFRVRTKLQNGVEVDLGEASTDELSSILQLLSRLPCFGSKRG